MADRTDFYFRQRVTEAELDLALALLEKADRNLATDIGVYGIISGAVPAPHSPVPDLSIDLTAPMRAYDRLGQRIFFGTDQTIDCTADHSGIPTDVTDPNQERWLGVFLRFDRKLSDPRTDGNSQQVYFRRDEFFQIRVRQAPAGAIGNASRVALQPDELLICDIHRRHGQGQILADDIDTSRREAFIFAQGDAVAIVSGVWNILQPAANTVQAALDAVDAELSGHFAGSARPHPAADIDYTPHAFITATNLQAAVDQLIDDLAASTSTPGSGRIGADAVPGTPHALPASNLDNQISQLLAWLNQHVGAPANAHNASAIGAAPHGYISGTSVQAQLQELVTDLSEQNPNASGATRIGAEQIVGAPNNLPAGTIAFQLAGLLAAINNHATSTNGAHPALSVSLADAPGNYDAANVEAALGEMADMFAGQHFRGNEPAPGQHRTIHQPVLGAGRVLLWESAGTGSTWARLRVYADDDAIWFTANAAWNATQWVRDDAGANSGGFRFTRSFFEFVHHGSAAAAFTDWTSTWRLPMGDTVNSAFDTTGTIREYGRLGMEGTNTYDASRTMALGSAVTFRARFPATPTSVTFTRNNSNANWLGVPLLWDFSRDGFGFFSYQDVPASATIWWFGTYYAIA